MQSNPTVTVHKLAYSIGELAQASTLSRATIYNEIRAGEIEVSYVGDRPLITVDEARRWLASKRKNAD